LRISRPAGRIRSATKRESAYGHWVLALFDLDNTLIDRQQGLEEWTQRFAHVRSLPPSAALVISERLRDRAYPADLDEVGAVFGLSDSAGDLWREYAEGMADAARCLPGVGEGLRGSGRSAGAEDGRHPPQLRTGDARGRARPGRPAY
jgi:hypothetical protein